MIQPDTLLDLLYQALNSRLGLVVETNNPVLLKGKLYNLMRQDPALSCLSLLTSRTHPDTQIIILRKPDEAAETYDEPAGG